MSDYTPRTLEAIREAEKTLSTRGEVQETFAMLLQSHGNIEHMISPAPLSIALLGQLILLSLETDFSLEVKKATNPPERLKYPSSLRASLLQVSHGGWDAFNLAQKNMDAIKLMTANVPTHVNNSVKIITGGSVKEMEIVLPKALKNIQRIATDCTKKAQDVENQFVEVMALISELLELCTVKRGEHEQEIEENKAARQAAEIARKHAEQEQKEAEQQRKEMREHFKQSREDYKKALDEVPSGLTLLGMSILEKASTAIIETVQMYTNPMRKLSAVANTGLGAVKGLKQTFSGQQSGQQQPGMTASNPQQQPQETDLRRTASFLFQLKEILDSLQQYFNTEGRKNLETQDTQDTRSITLAKATANQLLESMKSQTQLPLQDVLGTNLRQASSLIGEIEEHGNLLTQDPLKLQDLQKQAKELSDRIDILRSQVSLQLSSIPPPATPMMSIAPVQSDTSNDTIKTAVAQSRMKFEQTSLVMKQAMEQYKTANERSQAANREMAKLVSDIAMYELKKVDFETIRKTLLQGIDALGQVRAQWSQLVQYFQTMTNIIEITLGESLKGFLEDAKSGQELRCDGENSLSTIMRDSIYLSASKANQIAYLVQGLSATYVEVSTKYIMPPLAHLDTYMALDANTDKAKINMIRRRLDTDCKGASEAIAYLVRERHDEILDKGYARIAKYERTMRAVLPPPTQEEGEKIQKMKEAAAKPLPVGEDGW